MIPLRQKHNRSISQLCFGTAQLGIAYGIANQTGMPDAKAAALMIATACSKGITVFDTARAYGEAEQRVGSALHERADAKITVMTKLSPLAGCSDQDDTKTVQAKVREDIETSLQQLRLPSLPYLLLHRASHLRDFGGAVWQQLLTLKAEGCISRLGVSVSTPDEAFDALSFDEVECLQLPYNLLDHRWEASGLTARLSLRPEVLIVTRSALLQGLLTQNAEYWPIIPESTASELVQRLDRWVATLGRKSRTDLCLAFVRGQTWIDSIIIGMETQSQLQENIEMFQTNPLSASECNAIRESLPELPESLLNPALWPKRNAS